LLRAPPCSAEVELRSRLAEREARLQTLKQQLQPSATVKGVLPRDHRTGVRGTTASASTQQQQQQSLRNANSLPAAGASAAAAQPGERDYLAHQVAALRISLARRDADVQRLQGAYVAATVVPEGLLFLDGGVLLLLLPCAVPMHAMYYQRHHCRKYVTAAAAAVVAAPPPNSGAG
jgi:thiol:disulfide interchange protein